MWGGVAILVLAACSTHSQLSPAAVREQGEREVATLLKHVRVYDEPQVAEYLAKIAARVGGGVRVTVIEDPTLGAFAMPGGRVFVHTGLLSAIENEAQLALILARESARDVWTGAARARKAPLSTVALSPTAAVILGRDLRLAAAAAIEGDGDAERAADSQALQRLTASGDDPGEGAKVFRLLSAADPDRGELAEVFLYANRRHLSERDDVWRERLGGDRRAREASGDELALRMRRLVRENAALDARAGRFALARRQLDRVLASDPNDAVAQLYDGDLYRLQSQRADGPARTERVQRAIERYQRAAELDPRYAEPFRQLALLYYQQGDAVHAREAFERYLALAGDTPDARRIREYLAILGQ